MDVTPLAPAGSQIINGYGDGGFRIAGKRWEGSVLVTAGTTLPQDLSDVAALDVAALTATLASSADPVSLLLLGCGRRIQSPPSRLRAALKAQGVGLELMDTGAACRTFNVLLVEGRQVAALMVAV